MRWLILLLLLGLVGAVAKNHCHTQDFYSIAWGVHDPTERYQKMSQWLTKNELLCQSSDYVFIWNNLSEWGGNSDSHSLRAQVIYGYKKALEREKK
jgi:hypothetical protein